MEYLILLAVLAIPLLLLLGPSSGKKRGCGRGCATCGNRFICHPGQYKKEDET